MNIPTRKDQDSHSLVQLVQRRKSTLSGHHRSRPVPRPIARICIRLYSSFTSLHRFSKSDTIRADCWSCYVGAPEHRWSSHTKIPQTLTRRNDDAFTENYGNGAG